MTWAEVLRKSEASGFVEVQAGKGSHKLLKHFTRGRRRGSASRGSPIAERRESASLGRTSQPLLDELEQTLQAKFTLGPASVAFLEQLRLRVRIVEPAPPDAHVSRDADDDVLATAVAAGAALIVTGDQDLLVIDRYKGIEIVSPRNFLKRLSS